MNEKEKAGLAAVRAGLHILDVSPVPIKVDGDSYYVLVFKDNEWGQ